MEDITTKPILWGLDPMFHVYVKVIASQLNEMIPGTTNGSASEDPMVYFFRYNPRGQPRPIRLVSLCGMVVFLQHTKKVRWKAAPNKAVLHERMLKKRPMLQAPML